MKLYDFARSAIVTDSMVHPMPVDPRLGTTMANQVNHD